jgi:hypothetical protein
MCRKKYRICTEYYSVIDDRIVTCIYIYRKLIWGTLVPRHHALNTYILLTIMHTQGYTYPTHTYLKYAYPRYIYPGYTYPIYIYPEYIYIRIFTYLRYIFQKNSIPKVYIPYLCLLSMCKVIHTWGMYKTSRILYVLSMVPGHQGALVILPIYIYIHVQLPLDSVGHSN